MRIVVDMNKAVDWVDFLRERGHDAEHWSQLGAVTASDHEIMVHCNENESIILSNDLDFGKIHTLEGTQKPSVVQVRSQDLRPATIGHYVTRAYSLTADSLNQGAVVTIKPPRVRVSKLPIGNTEPS